jgi:serine/threonine protein kinase
MIIAAGSLLSGRYRLERELGQGGFGQVFLAADSRLKRRVAVKVLEPQLAMQSGLRGRFESETQRIAEVDHPNILSIYDYGEEEGTLYLVTPFVDGGTLAERLRSQGRLGLQEAGSMLGQAAAALDYAHERGIVHGGVSPQNMLLRDNGKRLLLTDFGIANALGSAAAQARADIAYLAPEQFQGNVGPAADLYALGCILFEMLTGAAPFTGSPEQIRQGHETSAPPSITGRSAGQLPESLQIVIEIALAKRPEDRFRSAGELAAAYQEACAAPVPDGAAQVVSQSASADSQVRATEQTATSSPPRALAAAGSGGAPTQVVSIGAQHQQETGPFLPAGYQPAGYQQPTAAQLLAARSWPWKIAQSWWVVVPFLSLSLLSWAAFIYIGIRGRRIRWLLWALVYFVAVVIVFAFTDTTLSGWVILLTWLGSSGHAPVVARAFLRRLALRQALPEQGAWIF